MVYARSCNINKEETQHHGNQKALTNMTRSTDIMMCAISAGYEATENNYTNDTAGYANDITLIASTVTDLQRLVNICYHYSCKWRFVFGPIKSKCIKMYKRISAPMESPDIWLGSNKLEFVNNVEILGRVFSNNLSSQDHIDIRIRNSRHAMYSIGLNNQAFSPSVKAYLWKSIQGSTLSPWQHVPIGHVVSRFYVPWQNFYVPYKITNYFPSHNLALTIEWAIFGEMSIHLRSVDSTTIFDRLGMSTQ